MTWNPQDDIESRSVWIPCGTCWGQRRLFTATAGTGRLVPHTCPTCMGVGERLTDGDHSAAATTT